MDALLGPYTIFEGGQSMLESIGNGADKERFHDFSKHGNCYKHSNNELKDWSAVNWDKWEGEKLEWFTAGKIMKIPSELLPDALLLKKGGKEN